MPLTRFGSEKSDFVKYLTAERDIEFLFENIKYHVVIENVAVFPQCYAAVADKLQTFNKKTLIVDIGSYQAFMSAISGENRNMLLQEQGNLNHLKLNLSISSSARTQINSIWDYYANQKH